MKNLLIGGIIISESPAGTSWKLDLQQNNEYVIRKIWTSEPELAESLHQAFPEAELVDDLNSLLEDPEIGLVIIVPPLADEQPVIGRALQSGKPVRVL
jgi:predicted dehydrogenase